MATYLPVLTFHALDDRSSATSFSQKMFERIMLRLHESGYLTMSLMETVNCLRQGKPFPNRFFVNTFEDVYQSVYDEVFPVLQRYGMSSTIFLSRKK